jgi:uncharacterized protein YggT (Ycf19 family)
MQMIVQLGWVFIFAAVPMTLVYLVLERFPPTRGQAGPAIHDLLNITIAPMLALYARHVRVPAVGRFDLTPFAALLSLGVGWMLIATVLGVF